MSLDSATSTYASRIRIAQQQQQQQIDENDQQQHPWKSFLHTTTTALEKSPNSYPSNSTTFITTEEWCSKMAKALESSLSHSERLRIPNYLVETIYGRTVDKTTTTQSKQQQQQQQQQPSVPQPTADHHHDYFDDTTATEDRSSREAPESSVTLAAAKTSGTTTTATRIRSELSPSAAAAASSSLGGETQSDLFLLKTRGSLLEGPRHHTQHFVNSEEDSSMGQWLDSTLLQPSSKKSNENQPKPAEEDEEEENLDAWLDSVIS
jgi:hypothetical protein